MKVYVHKGAGHWIGSAVVVVANNIVSAGMLIRQELDNAGLEEEKTNIVKVVDPEYTELPVLVLMNDGDY